MTRLMMTYRSSVFASVDKLTDLQIFVFNTYRSEADYYNKLLYPFEWLFLTCFVVTKINLSLNSKIGAIRLQAEAFLVYQIIKSKWKIQRDKKIGYENLKKFFRIENGTDNVSKRQQRSINSPVALELFKMYLYIQTHK